MKFKIITLLFLSAVLAVSLYYKDALFGIYNNFTENPPDFEKTELGKIVNEIARDIFLPPPLNIGGQENQVVLVKAKVIAETNVQRFDNGMLPPVVENAKLDAIAKAKADDMFEKQYFDHVSPSGTDPGELVKSFGYNYIVTGENLILGNFKSEAEVVKLWMDSPGHRENILNKRYTEIGVAMVKGTYKGQKVWIGVQEFGLPLSSCQEPDKSLKAQIDANKIKLEQLYVEIEAKKEEIDNTNRNSPRYNQLVDEYNAMVAEYNSLNDQTKNLISQYNGQVNEFNGCVQGG